MFRCGVAKYVEIHDNERVIAQWKESKKKQNKDVSSKRA
jgi:uncharacterized protein YbaA (DUF1428 family)